ncbi:hypothetical protein GBL_3177 [Geobacillus kaustophilus GBlys]|uniref:Uncharacterized protein n=1 Tax=Geobacillus kaustophilus GBlys TaxID=1337888 RepID=U2X7M2_GEOKU|nr:hypothetical protein GBL_3177 [Geobacillus kaustophilus GBlys]GAJ59753.1 hypothetical protein B23_2978 [Geobacillus thermoleovorans B23]
MRPAIIHTYGSSIRQAVHPASIPPVAAKNRLGTMTFFLPMRSLIYPATGMNKIATIEYIVITKLDCTGVMPSCFPMTGSTGISIEFPSVITRGIEASAATVHPRPTCLPVCFGSCIVHSIVPFLPYVLVFTIPLSSPFSRHTCERKMRNKWMLPSK